MKTYYYILFFLLTFNSFNAKCDNLPENSGDTSRVVISGKVRDIKTGEELLGASVYTKNPSAGTITNEYGFFSLNLKKGEYVLYISYVGFEEQAIKLSLYKNQTFNINMKGIASTLSEVVISDVRKNEIVNNTEMSVVKMKSEQIKAIPALMGEVDVIKAIQLMPGVQSTGEGFSGFNVRGGGSEQNLILLDEAPIYNASHLMGFFSVFNYDAVKDVKLYKGDIPVSAGGRLSSLLDIRQKDGNMKNFTGSAGIGTISSRLMLEGPIVKDKSSFIIAGRRSYADIFLPFAKDTNIQKNKLYFYDLNMKFNYIFNDKNRIFASGYLGKDVYNFDKAVGMGWGNNTQTVRWNHLFSQKLFSNITLLHSKYNYEMSLSKEIAGFRWDSNTHDYGVKADFGYYVNPNNTIRFGVSSTYHEFQLGKISPNGNPAVNTVKMPAGYALEHAAYIGNEQKINALISLDYGVRFSAFQNLGKGTVYNFNEDFQPIDSTVYASGSIFNTNSGLEPRLSIKYSLNETSSIKAGYSRTRQYVQLASNSQGGTPLDIWFPSNQNVKPQIADQIALGYFRTLAHDKIEASVEVYYKDMQNQIDFKDNAKLLMNPKLDGELRFGVGRAYGAEFFVRKQEGQLTGWISYTLSKSERKIDGINQNQYYSSNCDKTHSVSVVMNYEISKRLVVSANWVYSTGAPVTLPAGKFEYGNINVPVYSERNGYRLPDYHRLDVSLTLKGKEKEGKRFHGEWNLSVYNAYYRKNAFSISFEADKDNPSQMLAYKTYMFPIIPSITYNVKF
ncbi:MAG: hypothetical protein CVU05_15955 [Bacteroidetes bacterium HGW-Bacteroidetes-21]|nr:MAG: hypothetical protein CVU05_15955 [Bacteroidetes bacterium HGW-Bacteroidetes-21]